jgi:hypothetical protein
MSLSQEIIEALSKKIDVGKFGSSCLPELKGETIEYVEDIEKLLQQETDLKKLVAINRVKKLVKKERIFPKDINETKKLIQQDIETFKELISAKGVVA